MISHFEVSLIIPFINLGVDRISIDIDPDLSVIHCILIFCCVSIILPVSASSVGAYNVTVTHDYVKATAICSCGENNYSIDDDNYIYHTATFKNYCPHCKSYGTLKFNPKGVPEGEWTCTNCGSDYCAADGKEKISGSKYALIPYNPPQVQTEVKNSGVNSGFNMEINVITDLNNKDNKSLLEANYQKLKKVNYFSN